MKRIFSLILALVLSAGLLPIIGAPQEAVAAVPNFEVIKLVDNGSDDDNIVITFMGEGFTISEQDSFVAATQRMSDYILEFYPFSLFKDKINVYALKVISNESGVAPNENIDSMIDNFFGSFIFSGSSYMFLRWSHLVDDMIDTYSPKSDMNVVLLNSTLTGGIATQSPKRHYTLSSAFHVNPTSTVPMRTVVHELGHAFGGLADENATGIKAEHPNLTQNGNSQTISWKHWLGYEGIGVNSFFHSPDTYFRPTPGNCLMGSTSSQSFCAVCSSHLTGLIAAITKEPFHGLSAVINVTLPNGTKRILNYAFNGCEKLKAISIPASVTTIGRYAFLGCTSLETIVNMAATPQILISNVFAGVTRSNVTLHIPQGTKAAYEAAGWTGFKEVIEFDPASPPNITPGQTPATEVIVHSATPDTATINLTTETITLPSGFTVAAYSTDGGTKWRRGALPVAARFPRLLNKGMTLRVADSFDQKAKRPAADAQTIIFPRIGERPKRNAERLVPFYGDTNWVLAKRNTTAAVFTGYEYAPSANGRTPDDGQWLIMPQGGIPISSGSTRPTFIVRAAPRPDGTVAASVPWRVRPANFSKAPTYSIRQARVNGSADRVSVIAFRRGDQYAFGDGSFAAALTDKTTIPVSQLVAQGTELRVRRATTGRRPPSETQTITLPAPATATPALLELPLSLEPFEIEDAEDGDLYDPEAEPGQEPEPIEEPIALEPFDIEENAEDDIFDVTQEAEPESCT